MTWRYIPYGRQDISEEDIDAVVAVLRSEWLTQGPTVPRFEDAIAKYCGSRHAVAMSSATAALHVACLALDLGPGDWLWTSPNTFVASANCGLYCGAQIDFVDIDPKTYNMCVETLSAKLEYAERDGRLPKVVVPVQFAGQSCDMQRIYALSERYGFRILEDASHAIGGSYLEKPVGNCRFSDIAVFSFHPVKIITTGEGGVATTNDSALAARMALLRSHGITRDRALFTDKNRGPWYYQQIELGLNYRMTDVQAALGESQSRRLDLYVNRRHEIASRYDAKLADLNVVRPYQHPDSRSAYHLYPIWVDPTDPGRAKVFDALSANKIGVNVHYIPVHTQPYYQALGFSCGQFPNAERYYSGAISLPLFATLTESDQDRVINVLQSALA